MGHNEHAQQYMLYIFFTHSKLHMGFQWEEIISHKDDTAVLKPIWHECRGKNNNKNSRFLMCYHALLLISYK